MCGSNTQQKQIEAQQQSFMSTLQGQYQTQFGQNQEIMKSLMSTLTPIINAGPSQRGFSPEETAALKSQAIQSSGDAYKSAATALNQRMATQGGGNVFAPSAAQEQLRSDAANSAENNLSNQQMKITQDDYATGRANFDGAVGQLSGAAGALENPLSNLGNSATNAGSAASTTANEIATADNSWMGAVGGAAGGLLGGIGGGLGKKIGG